MQYDEFIFDTDEIILQTILFIFIYLLSHWLCW